MIRFAEPADISTLFALMREFAIFDGSLKHFKISEEHLYESLFIKRKFQSLVVESKGELVGFMNYFQSYSTFSLESKLWIEDVFILEEHRNRGFGKKLFDFIRVHAQDHGLKRIEWLVRRGNVNGINFYKNLIAEVDEETIHVKWLLR